MGITRLRKLNSVRTDAQVSDYFRYVCDAALDAQAKVGTDQARAVADRIWLRLTITGKLDLKETERLHEWALLLKIVDREIDIRGLRAENELGGDENGSD